MDEKSLDLNGEEETPSGSGQPEEEDSSAESTEKVEEDKVVLSKEEHAKLLEERDNYKKGLLSYKEKAKALPKEPAKAEDVLTKKDFQKINEKKAIEAFLKDNPEVNSKWSDFVPYYREFRGRDTVEDIVKDLDDAKTLYQKHFPVKENDGDTKANLASEKSITSGSSEPTKPQKESNKFLDQRGKSIQEWYK